MNIEPRKRRRIKDVVPEIQVEVLRGGRWKKSYIPATGQTLTPADGDPKSGSGHNQSAITCPPAIDTSTKVSYGDRKLREHDRWESIFPSLADIFIGNKSPNSYLCRKCGIDLITPFRCLDCCPVTAFCFDCIRDLHLVGRAKLHDIEVFDNHMFTRAKIPELKYWPVYDHPCQSAAYTKYLTIIDFKGRVHENCSVQYCSCEKEAITLYRHNLWAVSPTKPTLAVDVDLLLWWNELTLESAISLASFLSMIISKGNLEAHEASVIAGLKKSESLYRFRSFTLQLKSTMLGHENAMDCNQCIPGKAILAMDGNFQLVHKKNASSGTMPSTLGSNLFVDQDDVNNAVENSDISMKKKYLECSDFQAGDIIRSKNKTANLNFTGVFMAACRHEIPVKILNMKHGERFAYPTILLKSISRLQDFSIIMYDIACSYQSYVQKAAPELNGFKFAIPVFHSYAHKGLCQVTMDPKRVRGCGLSDGEWVERIWSYLSKFSTISKEMTVGHRQELLTACIGHWIAKKKRLCEFTLFDKLKNAQRISFLAEEKAAEIACHLPGFSLKLNIEKWEEEELNYFRPRKQKLLEMRKWDEKQKQLLANDASSTDLLEHERVKRQYFLQEIYDVLVEMAFLKSLKGKYTDGQKQAKRFCVSIRRVTKKFRGLVRQYESSNFMTCSELPNPLEMDNPVFFKINQEVELDVNWSFKREAIKCHHLWKSANEEIDMLIDEAACLYFSNFSIYNTMTNLHSNCASKGAAAILFRESKRLAARLNGMLFIFTTQFSLNLPCPPTDLFSKVLDSSEMELLAELDATVDSDEEDEEDENITEKDDDEEDEEH